MLARLDSETQGFLADWQPGFRKGRGCRDNILVLRSLIDDVLEQGKDLCATFIDYSAAFDSVIQKYIDRSLYEANASIKTRRMFRGFTDVELHNQMCKGQKVRFAKFTRKLGQ